MAGSTSKKPFSIAFSLSILTLLATHCDETPQTYDDAAEDRIDVADTSDLLELEEEVPVDEHGECSSSEDCGAGECVRVPDEPGGYWLCTAPVPAEATECTRPDLDECCSSAECTAGEAGGCYFHGDVTCPGGSQRTAHNQCFYTRCTTDVDCMGWAVCVPAGALGLPRNTCVDGYCSTSFDCSEDPDAYCRPFMVPCCEAKPAGFFCVTPAVCETREDCPEDFHDCLGNTSTGWAECAAPICI